MGILNRRFRATLALTAMTAIMGFAGPAFARDGQPSPWEIGFQKPATPIMHQIVDFHAFVTTIIVCITLFVMGLLGYVMIRYNERRNPVPSRTTHNAPLEIVWTVAPVLILVAIAIPSFRLLFAQYDYPKPDLTVTATGHQWYWSYTYPKQHINFDSILVQAADLKPGQPRLLTVTNPLVVPVHKNVIVIVKSADVIHDWAVPSFGVKLDAVPGRLQKTWFRAERTGTFRGQCSELCGRGHAFMPIVVKVVTEKQYQAWLHKTEEADAGTANKKNKFAAAKVGTKLHQVAAAPAAVKPSSAGAKTVLAAAKTTEQVKAAAVAN